MPPKSKIVLLTSEPLERLYIKYKRTKHSRQARPRGRGGRPDEQSVELESVPVQTPKTLGAVLRQGAVDWVKTSRPRGWDEDAPPSLGPLFGKG